MRKDQLERDVAGARTGRARISDREQSREPRAIVARRREGRAGEGFGVPHLQGSELPGCFEPVCGQGIGGDDEGRFDAFGRCGHANPKSNVAARHDQMLSDAIVKFGKRFGVWR